MAQLSNLLFVAVMIAVFWFLIIRPQQQRARQQREMLSSLKAGDEIVTIGGVFGTVVDVDERVLVKVFDGSEMEVARQAIAQLLPSEGLAEPEPSMTTEPASEDAIHPPVRDEDSPTNA